MLDVPLGEKLSEILVSAADAAVPEVIATLRQAAPEILAEEREMRVGFEERLATRWCKPLDLFELILIHARQFVQDFDDQHRQQAAEERDFTFEVLHRLAVRACRVASETLCLLRGGFADGAYARWRTLHELAVVAFFIQEAGGDTAERFLLYEDVEAYKLARELQKHAPKLNEPVLPAEDMHVLEARRRALADRYGPSFVKEYGWALDSLRRLDPESKQTTFEAIERCAGVGHMRPYYKMACYQVHGGPKGAAFTFSHIGRNKINIVGASNAGLDEPGQGACVSLVQLLTTLLVHKPDTDRLVAISVLEALAAEAADSFVAVQEQLEKEEEKEARTDESHA